MKDLLLKTISLGIAIALYTFVTSETNSRSIELIVPIEVGELLEGSTVISPRIPQTRVVMKGPAALVSRFLNAPPVIHVTLPKGIEGHYKIHLTPSDLSLPSYVQVQRIFPKEIELVIGKESEVPQRPVQSGDVIE